VVPGITAPRRRPAYAGIPVTYPGAGDTLTFIRGHEDGSQKAPVGWTGSRLARPRRHDRVLRGAAAAAGLVDALLTAGGRPTKDWAAVIFRGTLPAAATVHGTLGEIEERLSESGGRQGRRRARRRRRGGMREHLRWFDAGRSSASGSS
jgi:siroheme synthase